jgi:Putative beta-barrel porin-2, OmpL-like. bbp2
MRLSTFMLCLLLPLSVGAAESAAPPKGQPANFNPDISLILSGSATHLSNDPDNYAIPGFMLGAETGPGARGLSLGESELIVSANVDDLFYGQFTAALTPENEMEVEEAYVQTLGLPYGLSLRAGRFFSAIGYLNSQHPHAWDFVDTALAYRALLANQYGDDGVRLSWVAPTDLFVEFGGEWLRGENFPAGGAANNGQGAATLFAHLGGDVGASHAWRAGLSFLSARSEGRESGALDTAPDAFSGDSRVVIADLVWKWSPGGNPRQTNFKFQAEYLWRDEDGEFTADVNSVNGPAVTDAYRATHSGWYAQAVYQFMPQWRAGLRYDQLRTQEIAAGTNSALFDAQGHAPWRASLMLDWSHSEFSRLRLQVSSDHSQPDADSQVFVQYIMSMGAHGAHAF